MKKTTKRKTKKAPATRPVGKDYVVVKKEYLAELLTLKKHFENIEEILKAGHLVTF